MAITIPIISEFSDKGIVGAQAAFNTFKGKVGEAEGAMNKLKAGSGVAFDAVKANAGTMALAAGGAIAGFALKAIGDFSDLALAVDDFSNRTQLTLDQSSRWNSFTDDLGIEADAMIKIFDKLGKGASDQIPAFQELGVEIAFGPDGSTDIEETFFRVVDKLNSLQDPADRAKLSAELLGKGWQGAAEIINMSSDDIKTALGGVGDFEIIDEDEIRKAKELREAQDRLGDALAEISVEIGEKLIPALTNATDAAIPFLDAISPLVDIVFDGADANADYAHQISQSNIQMRTGITLAQKFFGWLGIGKDDTEELADAVRDDLIDAWKGGYRAMIDAAGAADGLEESLVDVDDALAELKGNIDERQAFRNLIDTVEEAGEAALKAFAEKTPESLRRAEDALDDARAKVAEYIYDINTIPESRKTDYITALDRASYDQVKAMLDALAQMREVQYMPRTPPGQGGINEVGSGGRPIGSSPIRVPAPFKPIAGNYSAVNVYVSGSVVSENDLVETVRKGLVNSQRNGAGLVYSNR